MFPLAPTLKRPINRPPGVSLEWSRSDLIPFHKDCQILNTYCLGFISFIIVIICCYLALAFSKPPYVPGANYDTPNWIRWNSGGQSDNPDAECVTGCPGSKLPSRLFLQSPGRTSTYVTKLWRPPLFGPFATMFWRPDSLMTYCCMPAHLCYKHLSLSQVIAYIKNVCALHSQSLFALLSRLKFNYIPMHPCRYTVSHLYGALGVFTWQTCFAHMAHYRSQVRT
jgi:hypothetical protein